MVAENRERQKPVFIPLAFDPGEAMHIDWGYAKTYIRGEVWTSIISACGNVPPAHYSSWPSFVRMKNPFWKPFRVDWTFGEALPGGLSLTMPRSESKRASASMPRPRTAMRGTGCPLRLPYRLLQPF